MKKLCKRTLCLLLTLALCAGLLSAFSLTASAASLEEKQRAVILTAFAYFDKGRPVQYDSIGLSAVGKMKGGTIRSTHSVAPEYGTPDETIFSVCSDYCYQVYYNVFGYKLCGDPLRCSTANLSELNPGTDAICAYKYDSHKDNMKSHEAIGVFLDQLQPGDIINATGYEGKGGHAMLYIGDFLGDGTKYILHCSGYKYNIETGEDTVECSLDTIKEIPGKLKPSANQYRNDGGISLISAETYIRNKYDGWKNLVLSAIRPLNEIKDDYPISESAKSRMQYPRLVIDRTATPCTRFDDVEEGGALTISIALKNNSKTAYKLPVSEIIPEGVTLAKVSDNGKVSDKNITWTVDLPAGGSKTLTIDYTVTAKRGETIVTGGGKVAEIPSNTLRIPVGGRHLTAEENAKLAEIAGGKIPDSLKGAKNDDFAQKIYNDVLGIGVTIPTASTIVKDVLKKTTFAGDYVYLPREDLQSEALAYRQMIVPELSGGFVWGEMDSLKRALDLKCSYLYPGDVVVELKDVSKAAPNKTLVYLGSEQFLQIGSNAPEVTDFFEFQKAHTYQLFFVLRPTLAYDDVHTVTAAAPAPASDPEAEPAEGEMKFTDIKKGDWFYDYVADLVNDGVVSGMTETTYAPNGTLTYGQALKLTVLIANEGPQAPTGAHWASGYLTLAKDRGWLTGDVNLDGTITRLAFCRIAAKAKGLTEQPETNPFTDTSDPDVLALYRASVINGMTEKTFEPNGLLTRAQIAKIVWLLRIM